jgi:hypothetical protein
VTIQIRCPVCGARAERLAIIQKLRLIAFRCAAKAGHAFWVEYTRSEDDPLVREIEGSRKTRARGGWRAWARDGRFVAVRRLSRR